MTSLSVRALFATCLIACSLFAAQGATLDGSSLGYCDGGMGTDFYEDTGILKQCPAGTAWGSVGAQDLCQVCKPNYFLDMTPFKAWDTPTQHGILYLSRAGDPFWDCPWWQNAGESTTACGCLQCPSNLISHDFSSLTLPTVVPQQTANFPACSSYTGADSSLISANSRCYCPLGTYLSWNATACGSMDPWTCYLRYLKYTSPYLWDSGEHPAQIKCVQCPSLTTSPNFNTLTACLPSCPAPLYYVSSSTGQCKQCPTNSASSALNSATCSCVNNLVASGSGDSLACTCPAGTKLSGNQCVCGTNAQPTNPSALPSASNPCVCLPGFQTTNSANPDGCVCPSSSVVVNGQCACAAGSHTADGLAPSASNPCLCDPNYSGSAPNCACQAPFTKLTDGRCACPANTFLSGSTCAACGPLRVSSPPDNTFSLSPAATCKCPAGFKDQDGVCVAYKPCLPPNTTASNAYQILALNGDIDLRGTAKVTVNGAIATSGSIFISGTATLGQSLPAVFQGAQSTRLSALSAQKILSLSNSVCLEAMCQSQSTALFAYFGSLYAADPVSGQTVQQNAGRVPALLRSTRTALQFPVLRDAYGSLSSDIAINGQSTGTIQSSGSTLTLTAATTSSFNLFVVSADSLGPIRTVVFPSTTGGLTIVEVTGSAATLQLTAAPASRVIFAFPTAQTLHLPAFTCPSCTILAPYATVYLGNVQTGGQIIAKSITVEPLSSPPTVTLAAPFFLSDVLPACASSGSVENNTLCIQGGNCYAPDFCLSGNCVKCNCDAPNSCQSAPTCKPQKGDNYTCEYPAANQRSRCVYAYPNTTQGCSAVGGSFQSGLISPVNVPSGKPCYGLNFPNWAKDRSYWTSGCSNMLTFFDWVVDGSVPRPKFVQTSTTVSISGYMQHSSNWRYQIYVDFTLSGKAAAGTAGSSIFKPDVSGAGPFTIYTSASGTLTGGLYLDGAQYTLSLWPGTVAQVGLGANGVNLNNGFLAQLAVSTQSVNDRGTSIPTGDGICSCRGRDWDDDDDCDWDNNYRKCKKGSTPEVATIRLRGDVTAPACSVPSGDGECVDGLCAFNASKPCQGFKLTTSGVYQLTNNPLFDDRFRSGLRCDGLFGGGSYQLVSFDFEYKSTACTSDVKLTWVYNSVSKTASLMVSGPLCGGVEGNNRKIDKYYLHYVVNQLQVSSLGFAVATANSADGGWIAKTGTGGSTQILKPSNGWASFFGLSQFIVSNIFSVVSNSYTAYALLDHGGASGHVSDTAFSFGIGSCLGVVDSSAYPFPTVTCPQACVASGVPVWSNTNGVLTATSTAVVIVLKQVTLTSVRPNNKVSFSALGADSDVSTRLRLDLAASITAIGSDASRVVIESAVVDGEDVRYTVQILPPSEATAETQERYSSTAAAQELQAALESDSDHPIKQGLVSSAAVSASTLGSQTMEHCGDGSWAAPGQCGSGSHLSNEAIAGVVVGCCAAVALSAAVAIAIRRRRSSEPAEAEEGAAPGLRRMPTATMIALKAARGEDVSAYMTPRTRAAQESLGNVDSMSPAQAQSGSEADESEEEVVRTSSLSQSRSVTLNPPHTVESLVELQQTYEMLQSNNSLQNLPAEQ